ncbi:MAG: NAD(P)H-quinone oxidoreductase [Rhizobiaceae bacterium]
MLAVLQKGPGGPDVLALGSRPVPEIGRHQVLIEVAYAGINRHDCNQRNRGTPPPGATDIFGLEVSGVVTRVGEDVDPALLGRRVCALTNGGGYAEFCVADADLVFDVPAGLSLRDAAALPKALFTSWFNLIDVGQAPAGGWVLIHGGTSGVGIIAIQLMRLRGVNVITTSGSDEKCRLCLDLGATAAINYATEDLVARVDAITGGRGVDVVLDMAGAMYAEKNLLVCAKDARVIHLATIGTPNYSVPFNLIAQKRVRVTATLLRPLEAERKAAIARALRDEVMGRAATELRPVIAGEFALADIVDAHSFMERKAHSGKILLRVKEV